MDVSQHIDHNVIEQYKSLDEPGQPSLLDELTHIFQITYLEKSESIKSAWQKEDYEQLRKEAHALRNTCANVGASTMVSLTHDLEYQDYPADSEKVQSQIRDLDDEYEVVIEELLHLSSQGPHPSETHLHPSEDVK